MVTNAVRIHCKAWAMAGVIQASSDGQSHAKANQGPSSSCSRGTGSPCGVFRALDGPALQKNSFHPWTIYSHQCYDYGTIPIWSLMIYFLLSENELIRPFPEEKEEAKNIGQEEWGAKSLGNEVLRSATDFDTWHFCIRSARAQICVLRLANVS